MYFLYLQNASIKKNGGSFLKWCGSILIHTVLYLLSWYFDKIQWKIKIKKKKTYLGLCVYGGTVYHILKT